MPKYQKLTEAEIHAALQQLPGWTLDQGKLQKLFVFKDFVHAFGFMATAALSIEKNDHHPEWSNVYNRVNIHLVTHDAGGVTQADVQLARLFDELATRFQ